MEIFYRVKHYFISYRTFPLRKIQISMSTEMLVYTTVEYVSETHCY